MMTRLDGSVSGTTAYARLLLTGAVCLLLLACGGGGGTQATNGGGTGSSGGSSSGGGGSDGGGSGGGAGGGTGGNGTPPATTLSCDHFPATVPVTVNGTTQNYVQVCSIVQEFAQVTPSLSIATVSGSQAGHGHDYLQSFVVYARIIAQAVDEGAATALAKSVVINTANGKLSSTPDQVAEPQFLNVDFEVFTAPTTNLTLAVSQAGNVSADNYNATLQLTTPAGNAALTNVQGQETVNTAAGNIDVALSGSSFTGAGINATTGAGNITASRPAGFQAAFTAKTNSGSASIDSNLVTTDQGVPAVVTAGSGAPITLVTKAGNVSVLVPQ